LSLTSSIISYNHIRSSMVSRPAFTGALSLPSFF
jgi:hypothetical protein